MTDQQLPIDDLMAEQSAAGDDQVAREEISRHYDQKVRKARDELAQKVAELEAEIAAAEAAQAVWETTGEITSTKASRDPRNPHLVESELMSLLLDVDKPGWKVWKDAMATPQDQELRAQWHERQNREKAVKRWLAAHGHGEHPMIKGKVTP
jgi:hypothetical protein